MKIIIIGYMASGKSLIGRRLALIKNVPFIDLDAYIETKEGCTISELFNNKGEIYFRKKEHQYLKELLEKEEDMVLSLGGGTPCYGGNMNLILNGTDCHSVYLKASINTLTERLTKDRANRPLIADLKESDLQDYIAKHLFERQFYYEQAGTKIKIDNRTMDEIIDELLKFE